jgi:hypothetical protein
MNGEMGDCPDWYELVRAARYLSVAPWALIEQSIYWKQIALKSMTAEARAQDILKNHKQ